MASKPDLSPPWTLFMDGGKPIAILPSGRPGEVFSVEGWSLENARTLVNVANQLATRATKKRESAGKRKL